MKMLDIERKNKVENIQMYITQNEAKDIIKGLEKLLIDPEANEHIHIGDIEMKSEISISIITELKLKNINRYTKDEQNLIKD